jgi:hypothetical protein
MVITFHGASAQLPNPHAPPPTVPHPRVLLTALSASRAAKLPPNSPFKTRCSVLHAVRADLHERGLDGYLAPPPLPPRERNRHPQCHSPAPSGVMPSLASRMILILDSARLTSFLGHRVCVRLYACTATCFPFMGCAAGSNHGRAQAGPCPAAGFSQAPLGASQFGPPSWRLRGPPFLVGRGSPTCKHPWVCVMSWVRGFTAGAPCPRLAGRQEAAAELTR